MVASYPYTRKKGELSMDDLGVTMSAQREFAKQGVSFFDGH
jgi:hypothetical protein